MLADQAHDTNQILQLIEQQSATPVIPSKKNCRKPRKWDKETYKERHLIECFFNKVKHYRRLATRFDKLASSFRAF
ncbi:transposase [Paenibacillus lautus]